MKHDVDATVLVLNWPNAVWFDAELNLKCWTLFLLNFLYSEISFDLIFCHFVSWGHSQFSTISPSPRWILPPGIDQVLLLRVLPSHCSDDPHQHRFPHKLCCRRKFEQSSFQYNLVPAGCIYFYPDESNVILKGDINGRRLGEPKVYFLWQTWDFL